MGVIKDFQNMQKNEEPGEHMKRAAAIAYEFKPVTMSHSNQ
jgi:hypothetical protein